MALELPVVATDAGGTRDAVEDGVTGYVVPPGDPLALVRASRPLLDDANLRMRLGRAGRARAERLFALEPVVESHLKAFELALARRRRVAHVVHTAGDPPAETSDLLRCPSCHSRLDEKASGLHCSSCQGTYRVIDGIPVLLQGIAHATAHKRHQAAFFDKTDAEFEIERPHGTVGLYEWLIDEKFRRSVAALRGVLVGATTLTVCGGSGMDAEFLANVGARVIASDLSLEAARRTRERARRHGVAIKPIVADVERLPFADRSIDVVFVHDGLHHLENPVKGLREMARVARVAVSVNEPAHAAVTRAAIRLGLASHHEEAGNFIGRLRLDDIVSELRRAGFEIVGAERYAMYYRHAPGGVSRMLSVPAVRHAAMAGILLFNAVAGSIGNKLTVQAMRA